MKQPDYSAAAIRYCTKCGEKQKVYRHHIRYESGTGEPEGYFWYKCPNDKWFSRESHPSECSKIEKYL